MFTINCVSVSQCRVTVVSGRNRPTCSMWASRSGLSAVKGTLKSIELQIAEVNQFWISDLRFGIEESMLEAGAVVDWGFSIWDAS